LIQRNLGRFKIAQFEIKRRVKEEDIKVNPRNLNLFYENEEEDEAMPEIIEESKEEAIANAKATGQANLHFSRL